MRTFRTHIPLIIIALLAIIHASYSSAGIKLGKNDVIPLSGKIDYFEDREGSVTTLELLDKNIQEQFQRLPINQNSFGVSNSNWWFRITIEYSDSPLEKRLLLLNSPVIFEALLFTQDNDKLRKIAIGGFAFPASERPIHDARLIFPLPNNDIETTYYLKIHNNGTLQLPLLIYKPEVLMEKRSQLNGVLGLYFGLLLSMVIYNLFIGWSTRDSAYFYYVGYMISLILLMAFNEGYAQLFVFSESPRIAYTGINLGAVATIMFATQFARVFLTTRKIAAKLDWWLKTNMLLAFLYAIFDAYLAGVYKANIIIYLSLSFLLSMLVTGVFCWYKRMPSAQYFVAAWMAMLLGSALMVLAKLGIIPTMIITEFGTHIGSSIEAMLLSFALAAKIKHLVSQRMEAELRSRKSVELSNIKLQESHKIKDDFFSALSHELRTPIHGVKGAIDLFSSNQVAPEKQEELEILEDSVNEILTYFDHLLILSQLKSEELELRESGLTLDHLVEPILKHFFSVAKERNILFVFNAPKETNTRFIVDNRVLSVCLYQLLSKEFEREGITAICFDIEFQDIDIQCTNNKLLDYKLIFKFTSTVEDQKQSSRNDSVESDYDPVLSRIENQFSRHKKGVLAIADSIQEALFDKLSASLSRTREKGSTISTLFELRVKIDDNKIPTKKNKSSRHITGLVVDDNRANRLIAEKYLEKLGIKTQSANDGREAINVVNNSEIDFILMDCHMPNINGYQATKIIRKHENYRNVPIIAVTADVTKECYLACQESGMNQVLYKPLSIYTLKETLAAFGFTHFD